MDQNNEIRWSSSTMHKVRLFAILELFVISPLPYYCWLLLRLHSMMGSTSTTTTSGVEESIFGKVIDSVAVAIFRPEIQSLVNTWANWEPPVKAFLVLEWIFVAVQMASAHSLILSTSSHNNYTDNDGDDELRRIRTTSSQALRAQYDDARMLWILGIISTGIFVVPAGLLLGTGLGLGIAGGVLVVRVLGLIIVRQFMGELAWAVGAARMASEEGSTLASKQGTQVSRRKEATGVVWKHLDEDPWMNDWVLDNVFNYCTPEMISACRLVSKKWYTASLPAWKANSRSRPIQIECKRNPAGRRRERDGWRKELGSRYIFDFVLDFHIYAHLSPEINGVAQYSNFALNFDRTSFVSSPENWLDDFWAWNGAWITSLKIFYHAPLEVDFLRRLFSCDLTPQLERLDVQILLEDYAGKRVGDLIKDCSSFHLFEDPGQATGLKSLKIAGQMTHILIDWSVYLRCYCPNLENLDLSECNWNWGNNLKDILRVIKRIRAEDPTKLCLKSLSWSNTGVGHVPSPVCFNLLKEMRLDSLESLSFSYGRELLPYNPDQQYVSRLSKSLKKKIPFLHWAAPFLQFQTPPFLGVSMAHLSSLVVEGVKPFGNLSFLAELPALRSLKLKLTYEQMIRESFKTGNNNGRRNLIISATEDEDMMGGGGGTMSLPSRLLSSFSCDYWGDFEPRDLSRLQSWMPALTRLELRLNNESFRKVCQVWPKLQHVTIFGGRIGDRGIVGRRERSNGGMTFKRPNITNLQDLQSFVITPRLYYYMRHGRRPMLQGAGELTVHSVKHGLAKCRRLEQVTLDKVPTLGAHKKLDKYMKRVMPRATINWL